MGDYAHGGLRQVHRGRVKDRLSVLVPAAALDVRELEGDQTTFRACAPPPACCDNVIAVHSSVGGSVATVDQEVLRAEGVLSLAGPVCAWISIQEPR